MLKLISRFKFKEWLGVILCAVLIVGSVYFDLKIPEFTQEITRLVKVGGHSVNEIWAVGVKMLLYGLASLSVAVITGLVSALIAANFSKRIRNDLFNKVQSFSMEEINKFSTASLITRSTNDVTQIAMVIAMGLHVLIKAPVMAVWAISKISVKSYQWTVAAAIALLFMILSIVIIMIIAAPRFKKMQRLIDDVNRDLRENLTGLKVVRAYNAENFQQQKFEKSNKNLTQNFLGAAQAAVLMNPLINAVQNGLTLAIYWLGASIINSAADAATRLGLFGDMVTFSNYSMQVIMSFMMLTFIFMFMPRANAAAVRINEVLNTKTKICDGALTQGATLDDVEITGEVEFKNVSFKYPDAQECVLEDISFVVKRGETVAFIGSTGSGKSTLINLVPRFYDVTEGEVKIDGVNVKDYTEEALRNKLGYVPQQAILYGGTVTDNIAFGENGREVPTEKEILMAAQIAKCADFIQQMPDGFNSRIAQNGANLSGGQKQRIAIARAIARKPEIYIFDDSFSALDFKTDKELRRALKKYTEGATLLIVAQRVGTIMDADKIIVLEQGKMVGIGTHKHLYKTCEVYRQIVNSQLSMEDNYER